VKLFLRTLFSWDSLFRWGRSLLRWGSLSLCVFALGWILALVCVPFPHHWLERPEEGFRLLDREGQALWRGLNPDDVDHSWLPLEEAGEWVPAALIAVEDQRFATHVGVDPVALLRAIGQNLYSRRVVSGASTISTQVIRLVRPRPRTLSTKFFEAFRAMQMEIRYDKAFILEQYINRAPFGGNRMGLASAARRSFGKEAELLSAGEAALLAGLPQSPSRFDPSRFHEAAERRREMVLLRMEAEGLLAEEPILDSGRRWVPPPLEAPAFRDWIRIRYPDRQGSFLSSLDPQFQAEVEALAAQEQSTYQQQGLDGIAMLVVEARSGKVRAMLGGWDPEDPLHGHINSCLRRRSVGSTLKPFFYAMAMEQGWLQPQSLLPDRPRSYLDYRPENMDQLSNGEVSAREALIRSLNHPALALLERIGAEAGLQRMQHLFPALQSHRAEDLGLGLALGGGVELSLLELCEAYSLFATGGERVHLVGAEAEAGEGEAMMHPGVSYWISDMLSGAERDPLLYQSRADVQRPRFAFKTGTSHGHRDAWALGWNGNWVIGIWLGRMDGAPVEGLSGGTHAAPLLATLFGRLPVDSAVWPQAPESVGERQGQPWIAGLSDPQAQDLLSETGCRILSPPPQESWVLGGRERVWISLRAEAEEEVNWFLNGIWVGRSESGESLPLQLMAGAHQLRAVSASGHADERQVELLP